MQLFRSFQTFTIHEEKQLCVDIYFSGVDKCEAIYRLPLRATALLLWRARAIASKYSGTQILSDASGKIFRQNNIVGGLA